MLLLRLNAPTAAMKWPTDKKGGTMLDKILIALIVGISMFIAGLYAGNYICNTGGWVVGF